MTARIQKLTTEQEAILPDIRDEWLAYGLATGPAGRYAAEAGVADAYRAAGLRPPRIVVWLDSPYAGAIGAWILGQMPKKDGWAQVRAQVGDQVGAQVRDQVGDQVYRCTYGQHDAGWLAFYDVFARIGMTGARRLAGMTTVAKAAGWWWPMRDAVILTERPVEMHRDNQQRLHRAGGAALRYPDGFAVHAWHGRRVPDWAVTNPTVEQIAAEANIEIRRCAIERLGWDRYITAAGLNLVGAADDPGNPGQRLELYDVPHQLWGTPTRVLLCTNGTPERDGTRHRFGLTTPATLADPVQAAAWTYGLSRDEYAKAQRRT